jgi:hypothetical protein
MRTYEFKLEGRKKMGRPRLRWMEDVKDHRVTKGKQKAVNREKWASLIKEGKVLRGLQSQGVSKYVST